MAATLFEALVLRGMHRASSDRDVRVIVLTGAGDRAFSAGGNLKPGDKSPFKFDHSAPTGGYAELLHMETRCELPLVARVNGHCLAGGMGLLAMFDLAVASNTATFGLPEVKIGMFPMQVGAVIQNLIPRRKLMEMRITGERILADETLATSLVNYVVTPQQRDSKVEGLASFNQKRRPQWTGR